MKNLIKFTAFLVATLLTISQAAAKSSTVSPNIAHAPAIEASYDQIQNDLAKHIGTNVRWGGQVINSEKIGDITRVTLVAYPLDSEGRPFVSRATQGNTFVVDFDKGTRPKRLKDGSYITVFGTVDGSLKFTNGPLEKSVPVIASQEAKKWKKRDIAFIGQGRDVYRNRVYVGNRFGFGSSRFGFGSSRFGFGSSRFGFGSSRFGFRGNRFGFSRSKFGFGGRGFSRFGRFGRY